MWNIEATVKKKGMIRSQSKLVAKSSLKLVRASDLAPGDWFYQVHGLGAVRRLKFVPYEFTDPEKYSRELDKIGIWILRTQAKKKGKVTATKLSLGL